MQAVYKQNGYKGVSQMIYRRIERDYIFSHVHLTDTHHAIDFVHGERDISRLEASGEHRGHDCIEGYLSFKIHPVDRVYRVYSAYSVYSVSSV